MFVGREKELKTLNELYNMPGLQMAVIYGRRRIGKSTLITEFIKDKRAIYYTATKVGKERNVELLSRRVLELLEPGLKNVSFNSLEDLLDFMTGKLTSDRLVFVIDELPYWAEKDEGLLSVLQKYIDNDWADRNMMIILCGSALSFMEDRVLSEKSPLFGRRSAQIKLDAFNYIEAALFVPKYSNEDKAICYGVTGGVAKYLAMINPDISLDENIKRLFFDRNGYLYDETKNLLVQEFSDITLVNNIIEQIASGENTVNVIADKVHENESTVLYLIGKLINVGLVEKKRCIAEESNRKKTQYVLKDNMFKFWYEFIPKACSVIEMDKGAEYYDRAVRPMLHSFMGRIFEEMCRYYTLKEGIAGKFDCFLTDVGTWWGTEIIGDERGNQIRQSADVDVVGISTIDKVMIAGECKFKNEKVDRTVYETLVRRSKNIPVKYRIVRYLLFSLSGYSEWFDGIDKSMVSLFTLDDLYKCNSSAIASNVR